MDPAILALLAAIGALMVAVVVLAVVLRQGKELHYLRLIGDQTRLGLDAAATTQRAALSETERAVASTGASLRTEVVAAIEALRTASEQRLGDLQRLLADQLRAQSEQAATAAIALRAEVGGMRAETHQALLALREGNEKKLAEIQGAVSEQLAKSVEQQMTASFTRVTEQFAQVQKAMGEMQAVGAQIGDLKRLFGNVKTRGGWGETQVRAMLDDVLPPGAYETNWKPRADSNDAVEFAVIMPMRGTNRPRLAVDAKFPVEAYERLLTAQDAANGDEERAARRDLAASVRGEARKIAAKYIVPPVTVEFAVMYLPTDGLYAEVARIDGLIDELGRLHRVLVMGPSLFPALLRTIHLGHVTLALEQKADEVRLLLGAARGEMQAMDKILDTLGKQVTTVGNTIARAQVRTRAVDRKLRAVDVVDPETAARLIGSDEAVDVPAEAAEDGEP